jgi:hypothetical protein
LLQDFNLVLFAGTPFAMGVVAGYTFNRDTRRGIGKSMILALACIAVAAAMILLFAFEGLICVTMALPLAIPLTALGTLLGRSVASDKRATASPLAFMLLVMPPVAWIEPAFRVTRLHKVTSQVHVNASPEQVWRHLVAFTPIPPPTELYFRFGVAYPVRARIVGQGVGATRYCEFSTGAFTEPITEWHEPHILSFDVVDQPDPLRELSPYPRVYVDHLDGSIASKRGQFRLASSPDGGTVLEGTTWYEISMYPETYWSAWTSFFVRAIHLRVLKHIKADTEHAVSSSAT